MVFSFRDIFSKVLNYVYSVPFLRDLPIRFIDANGLKYYARFQDRWRFIKPFEPITHEFLVKKLRKATYFLI